MPFLIILIISLSSSLFAQTNSERLSSIKNIQRFAFGSCNDQNDAQPLWKDMISVKPDLFIWGGDAVYADWETNYNIKASYEKQNAIPEYQNFKALVPMIGVWDDHDYAWDNANGTVVPKVDNQKIFLDFLEEAADSPRRKQEGVYTSYEYGDEGKKVKFILIDNRFFKDLDETAPMLGQKQWAWVEEELKNSKASINFIMTGISVLSPAIPVSEEWADYPQEQKRMLDLVKKYSPKGVVFLSGDKHFATIFENHGYLEFLSSGMTHVAPRKTWWYLAHKFPNTYFGLNYGLVDIAWEETTPIITLSLRSQTGENIQHKKYKWVSDSWVHQKNH